MARGEKGIFGGGQAFQWVVEDGGSGHACGVAADSSADLATATAAADDPHAFSGGDNGPSHGVGLLP